MNTRRQFIKQSATAGILLCCGISLDSCGSAKYIYLSGDISKLIVRKSDFGEKKTVILKHEKFSAPIYLVKKSENDYDALLMLCTHKGCELRPAQNYLLCPCHGSEFSNSGDVIKSPATEKLKKFETGSDDQNIYVYVK